MFVVTNHINKPTHTSVKSSYINKPEPEPKKIMAMTTDSYCVSSLNPIFPCWGKQLYPTASDYMLKNSAQNSGYIIPIRDEEVIRNERNVILQELSIIICEKDKTHFAKDYKQKSKGNNKSYRKKGFLKQPGGASCDQRR